MNNKLNAKLFWFAPGHTQWDVSNPAMLRTVIQQVLTHGRTQDVKDLLKEVPYRQFYDMFEKIKRFLPKNVRIFWEAYFGHYQ